MEHQFHRELKAQVARFCAEHDWVVYTEVQLPNRRIADVIACDWHNNILVFEVKTTINQASIQGILDKYRTQADAVYLAAPGCQIFKIPVSLGLYALTDRMEPLGLLALTGGAPVIHRQAVPHRMHEAVRNELTVTLNRTRPGW